MNNLLLICCDKRYSKKIIETCKKKIFFLSRFLLRFAFNVNKSFNEFFIKFLTNLTEFIIFFSIYFRLILTSLIIIFKFNFCRALRFENQIFKIRSYVFIVWWLLNWSFEFRIFNFWIWIYNFSNLKLEFWTRSYYIWYIYILIIVNRVQKINLNSTRVYFLNSTRFETINLMIVNDLYFKI